MKRIFITFFLFCLVMLVSVASYASTLKVSIDGIENLADDNIWSYQMNWSINTTLDISSYETDFNVTDQHLWNFNWKLNWNNNDNDNNDNNEGKLIVLADDNFGENSPLVNGELFTITYPDDTEITLTMESFLLTSASEDTVTVIDKSLLPIKFDVNDKNLNLAISQVPIPTTLFLLGSGLIGLIGVRRKQMNK